MYASIYKKDALINPKFVEPTSILPNVIQF